MYGLVNFRPEHWVRLQARDTARCVGTEDRGFGRPVTGGQSATGVNHG